MIFSVRNGVIGLMELEYLALLIFKPEINDHIVRALFPEKCQVFFVEAVFTTQLQMSLPG
jgi:hypothetical protein